MRRKDIKYYAVIIITLIIIVVFEALKPQPIDWRFTLERKDKIPYGTYVLYNTLEDIFPGKQITENKKTSYELSLEDDKSVKNYIYISKSFSADELETSTILYLADLGNNIFISSYFFSGVFSDTLNLQVDYAGKFTDTLSNLNFYNKFIKEKNDFVYGKSSGNIYFSSFDTVNFEVLAHSKENNAIFIRKRIGKGWLYLNTTPEVYTNYAMVAEENYKFSYNSLSYLPIRDVVWDEYYKEYRRQEKSALSYIFNNPSFKAGYYLLLLTALLFVIFTAKRRQRIIPVIKPYKNTSLEFAHTIGRLYFHSKNHKDIALKKFNYLQHFILSKYNINIAENQAINYDLIAEKTGTETETIKKVLSAVLKIYKLEKISGEQLNTFNNHIEDFYETCK